MGGFPRGSARSLVNPLPGREIRPELQVQEECLGDDPGHGSAVLERERGGRTHAGTLEPEARAGEAILAALCR